MFDLEAWTMWTGGDAKAGFEVSVDGGRSLLRFRFWGTWDEPLAQQFRDAALRGIKQLANAPRGWTVLADISRYPPQRPEVQKYHAELMARSAAMPSFRRAANLVDNTFSAMQIRRLSEESKLPDFSFFRTEAEALAWLREALTSSPDPTRGPHDAGGSGESSG